MNIIRLAKQSGMVYREFEDEFANGNTDGVDLKTLQAFANLVVAQEREECAKLAETTVCDIHLPTGTKIYGSRVATAIRARGTT